MPSVACAGMVSGSITRQKILNRDALSSIAASSMSLGIERKYCVIRKTPKAFDRPGKMKREIGVVHFPVGKHLVARDDHSLFGNGEASRTKTKIAFLNGNSVRAKP